MLLLFIQNKNIALFRDRIYEAVWGDYYMGDSRTVDLHVQRMRKSLDWKIKLYQFTKLVIVWREIDEFFLEAVF